MSQNRAVVPFIPPGQPVYEHHQGINIPATSSTQPRSVSSAQTQCSRPLCSDQSKLRLYQSRKKVSFHLQQKRNAQPKETNKKYQHKMTPKGSVSAPVQAGPPIPNVARLLTLSGKTGEEVASALGIDYVAMHNILVCICLILLYCFYNCIVDKPCFLKPCSANQALKKCISRYLVIVSNFFLH